MSYEEAKERLFNVRWKTKECFSENCWCALIVPEEEYNDDDGNEMYICGSGCISKDVAEYIVKIHNLNVGKNIS
jgi:hypothetical protein